MLRLRCVLTRFDQNLFDAILWAILMLSNMVTMEIAHWAKVTILCPRAECTVNGSKALSSHPLMKLQKGRLSQIFKERLPDCQTASTWVISPIQVVVILGTFNFYNKTLKHNCGVCHSWTRICTFDVVQVEMDSWNSARLREDFEEQAGLNSVSKRQWVVASSG